MTQNCLACLQNGGDKCGMDVGARRGAFSISNSWGFVRMVEKNNNHQTKPPSEPQSCGWKCRVDETGQSRIERLVWADRKARSNNHSLQLWWAEKQNLTADELQQKATSDTTAGTGSARPNSWGAVYRDAYLVSSKSLQVSWWDHFVTLPSLSSDHFALVLVVSVCLYLCSVFLALSTDDLEQLDRVNTRVNICTQVNMNTKPNIAHKQRPVINTVEKQLSGFLLPVSS